MTEQLTDTTRPKAAGAWPLRVLIVDDAASTRRLLRGVLESSPTFEVIGEADNGAVAVDMAYALQPDVVLLDLSMPVSDGASALSGVMREAPKARVIILSGRDDKIAPALLAAGAVAFLPKGLAPFDLLDEFATILGLPLALVPTMPPTASAPIAGPLPRPQPRAVLCDDTVTRRLVAQVLATVDVPVIAETDGVPNLLSIIGLAKPELVVLDPWLEGVSGTSALHEIRDLSPGTVVIVYSAHAVWSGNALAAGAAAFVTKPHIDELQLAISRLIPTTASFSFSPS
jgi:DNA-binding NarL/FixJ family response regulator